jgi:hypothetical protein
MRSNIECAAYSKRSKGINSTLLPNVVIHVSLTHKLIDALCCLQFKIKKAYQFNQSELGGGNFSLKGFILFYVRLLRS